VISSGKLLVCLESTDLTEHVTLLVYVIFTARRCL